MKRLILFELIILFLATTFESDSPPGWYQQTIPRTDVFIEDIFFLDSLTGHIVTRKNTNDSAFIYKTTDGGINWILTLSQNIYLTSIQFANNSTGYSVGSAPGGIIKKTTNSGLNWFTVNTIAPFPLLDLYFVNENTGWVCSDDIFSGGVFKTTNGGVNWQPQLGASSFPKKLFFLNQDTGWVVCQNTKLLRTTNAGMNWIQTFDFPQDLADVFFITRDTGYVSGGGGSSSIKKTVDGGFNWISYGNTTGGNDIYFLNNNFGIACAVFSTMEKTTDGGLTWFAQTVPTGNYYAVQFTDTTKGWSGGTKLIHTSDGGGPPVAIQQINSEVPSEYRLFQNYPNPFNPTTNIKYTVKRQTSNVKLVIYNIQGKQVTELVNQKQTAGTYEVNWSADGGALNYPSGVYFYSLIIEGLTVETRKMILIK